MTTDPPTAEYQLKLYDATPRIQLSVCLGLAGLALAAYLLFGVLLRNASDMAIGVGAAVFTVAFFAGVSAFVKATTLPSLVRVAATQLSVHSLRRDELTLCVAYADIAAYRHQSLNGKEELRLTLRSGERKYLKVASNLGNFGDFAGMVRQFEQQLARFAAAAAPTSPSGLAASGPQPRKAAREKSFWEKPLATAVLVAATVVLGLLIWQVILGNLPVANVVGASAAYVACVVPWLAARRKTE